ncbi:MAG: valine--tRNA ligase [bacterium]|nr:valine--tRNA ligase [bacterium]
MIEKKYNALEVEAKWQKNWTQSQVYAFKRESNQKPVFSVDTPPPYVSSSHLHVGHAMSYIQAEIITRFRRMQGYNVFYPMGFDDNGLPTERFVEKKYKINKQEISRGDFISLCLQETEKGRQIYHNIWDKLGIGVDWSLSYSTIGNRAQYVSQKSFLELFKDGFVYRENAPSFWCTFCGTALAQADLDDEQCEGVMYHIIFQAVETKQSLTIATTRPEMLPACVALYVHPNDERFIQFVGKTAVVPYMQHAVPILTHTDVDRDIGTGIMMVCTWGDAQDVQKWKQDKLITRVLLTTDGKLTDIAGSLKGLSVLQARSIIVQSLQEQSLIVNQEAVKYIKNVHERCGTQVEFVASPQWFIKILDHKDDFLQRGKELTWLPEFMQEKYRAWVECLKWDWCISRSRFYGVPIPVWYCQACGEIVLPDEDMLPIDPREHQPSKLSCSKCQGRILEAEQQVLDTWMTSSLTPLINSDWGAEDRFMEIIYPMSLRVQAFEIIRTWLFYTVVKSHYHTNSLPWKNVMISGWGLDSNGKKMSKSKGNFVAIETVLQHYPADAIRWWATNAGLGHNLRYTEEDIKNGRKVVIKLWNVARFIEALLSDNDVVPESVISVFSDRWILAELQHVIKNCTTSLSACDYNAARISLEKFFWVKYCDNYLELCKDRTWHPEKYPDTDITSMTFTLHYTLDTLLKLMAPFLPFVTEEIYHNVFKVAEHTSIHTCEWPVTNTGYDNNELLEIGEIFVELLNKVRHFKSQVVGDYRGTISAISLHTENKLIQQMLPDLIGIANACHGTLNQNLTSGQLYETTHPDVKLTLQ